MKVVLAGVNARYTHSNLALYYLRNEVRAEGHEASILEFHISEPRLDIVERIVLERPEALLLSAYVWNAQVLKLILPDLRRLLPDAAIVLGGPEAGYSAGTWLTEFPFLSCVVRGPGEDPIRRLARQGFRIEGERTIAGKERPFSEIPFPYDDEDLGRFARRYVYYESSRGCPFACSYCLSSRTDQGLEEKDAETAISELSRIVAYEPRWPAPPIVKFVDRSFNADPGRARSLWRFLMGAPTRATYHFEIHPGLLEAEDLALLAGAAPGRFQFEIGVQSVNGDTLRAVGRGMDWGRAKAMIARLVAMKNIHIHLDMIAGLPGEDLEGVARTLDETLALKPDCLQLGFLKSLPGTRLDEEAPARGQIAMAGPPYQVLANESLGVAEFRLLRRIEALLDSLWNANRLEGGLDELAKRHGGYFGAFRRLSDFAEEIGFDLTTKNREKAEAFLARCLAQEGA